MSLPHILPLHIIMLFLPGAGYGALNSLVNSLVRILPAVLLAFPPHDFQLHPPPLFPNTLLSIAQSA